jgi:hypothetical protein
MNCQRVQGHFLDYQAGTLAEADAAEVRLHLKTCLDCQREWAGLQETLLKLDRMPAPAPSGLLRERFYAMLEEEQASIDAPSPFALARSRIDAFFARLLPQRPVLQAAVVVAVLATGLTLGARFLTQTPAPGPAVATLAPDPAVQRELAELRKKVDSMGQLVAYSLQQQQSGNQRLQGVVASLDAADTNDRTLSELLQTLAFDPSTNVRLCALEALYPHAERAAVRAGVLAALSRERSPLVQVAMIDFISAARDASAASALEEFSRTPALDQTVREAARRALVQL